MAGHLQQLLGTDGDLADEDFLSAVEDAENRFGTADPADGDGPVPPGPGPGPGPGPVPSGPVPPPRLGLRPLSVRDGGPPVPGIPTPQRGPLPRDAADTALLAAARAEPQGPGGPCENPRGGPAPGAPRPAALSAGVPRAAAPAAPRLFHAVGGPPREAAPRPPRQPAPQTPVVTNHLVQLVAAASKAPRAGPRGPAPPKRRRFPGPAGILPQQQHPGRRLEEILVSTPQTPAHGALAKLRTKDLPSSPPLAEEDFGKGPWVAMKMELGLDERDPSCFLRTYSVVMVLRKAALKQLPKNKVPSMAVMIKTLTRSNVDAGAVFRDPTGEMPGTVHRALLEERRSELKPGSVLLLKQVGVFSPSHRNHYLNVTPNNLLKIYTPESEGTSAQTEQQVVAAWAGLDWDHPAQRVPVPRDEGPSQTNSRSSEWAPGGFSLQPGSYGPRQEEPLGAAGCDVDDLDGLLGELPEDFFSAPAQADAC